MVIEQFCIIMAPVLMYAFWDLRAVVNFAYAAEAPPIQSLLPLAIFQLVVTTGFDVASGFHVSFGTACAVNIDYS